MAEEEKATPGGGKRYKPLKEQLQQLKKAIKMTEGTSSKEIARQCQDLEKEVKELCENQQKTLEDRIPLHSIFQLEGEKCEKRIKELEEESLGRFQGRKLKAEKKLMMEKQSKYCKLMIVSQGVSHWMQEEVDDIKPALKKKAEAEGKLYPSLKDFLSAPPPPYICPVVTLEGGNMWGPDGKTGIVTGGIVNLQENPIPSTSAPATVEADTGVVQSQSAAAASGLSQPHPVAGTSQEITTRGLIFTLPPSLSSPDRATEEAQPVASTSTGQVTSQQPGQENPSQEVWMSEEDSPSLQYQRAPSKASHKTNRRSTEDNPETEQWQGHVFGKESDNREAVIQLERLLRKLEDEGVATPRSVAQTLYALEKDLAASVKSNVRKSREVLNLERGGFARNFQAPTGMTTLRSGRVLEEPRDKRPSIFEKNQRKTVALQTGEGQCDTEEELPLTMPLLTGARGEPVYHPYNIRDLEALVKQLPPITEGGAAWLRRLGNLTEGEELALGDFRAIGGRTLRGGGLADVEEIARTACQPNDVPYARVRNALSDAVREKYPTHNIGTTPRIVWSPEQSPREFMEHAKEQWILQTGEHPGQNGEPRAWFRSAVLAGLPERVTKDLQKNPDFAVADSAKWERHIIHRLELEKDEVNKKKQELEEAQGQLVKLKLAEAREKLNEKKKENKDGPKKMLVAQPRGDPGPDWPDLNPVLYPDDRWPANGPRQERFAGNWGATRSLRGRGGSQRGGGPRGRGLGGPMLDPNVCRRCGGRGHWVRDCPTPRQLDLGYPSSPQAQGAFRGRVVQTRGHQAPNPGMAPAAQYPVADWGREEELY